MPAETNSTDKIRLMFLHSASGNLNYGVMLVVPVGMSDEDARGLATEARAEVHNRFGCEWQEEDLKTILAEKGILCPETIESPEFDWDGGADAHCAPGSYCGAGK